MNGPVVHSALGVVPPAAFSYSSLSSWPVNMQIDVLEDHIVLPRRTLHKGLPHLWAAKQCVFIEQPGCFSMWFNINGSLLPLNTWWWVLGFHLVGYTKGKYSWGEGGQDDCPSVCSMYSFMFKFCPLFLLHWAGKATNTLPLWESAAVSVGGFFFLRCNTWRRFALFLLWIYMQDISVLQQLMPLISKLCVPW